jgi:hypothetical protein
MYQLAGTPFLSERLECDFEVVDGYLDLVIEEGLVSGAPIEAFLTFAFTPNEGQSYEVDSIEQLQGLVRIETPNQALNFVRLITSRKTNHFWGENPHVEFIPHSDPVGRRAYADDLPDVIDADKTLWGWGFLSDDEFTSAGFAEAKAVRVPAGFEVVRFVVEFGSHDSRFKVMKWTERVGEDGMYEVVEAKNLAKPENMWEGTTFVGRR